MGNGAAAAFPGLSKAAGWRSRGLEVTSVLPLVARWSRRVVGMKAAHPVELSASCLDPEFGHLGKLAILTPVSGLNLGLAELFPLEFCVSVPPLLLEEARLSFTSSFLPCLLCLTPLPLPSHRSCFLHGFPLLSPTPGLTPAPCCLFGAEFITISIMCLVYKAQHCLTQALGVNHHHRHPGNCPANPEELFCCLQQ